MESTVSQILVSVIAGAFGAGITYWFWVRQQVREIRRSYDQELRTAQFAAYQDLWKGFEPLAVYAQDADITYARIGQLGVGIRTWYFEQGGLVLTERARDVYFLVQDAIDQIMRLELGRAILRSDSMHWTKDTLDVCHKRLALDPLPREGVRPTDFAAWTKRTARTIRRWPFGRTPDDDFVLLQFLASSLRTQLARDLHARNPSVLDDTGLLQRLRHVSDHRQGLSR